MPGAASLAGTDASLATVLDLAMVEPIRVGQPDLWRRLVCLYLEDTPVSLAALEQAIIEKDCAAVHLSAHTMKSSSASMGATMLAELCRRLEAAAGEGNLEPASALREAICDEFAVVSGALARDRVVVAGA